MSMAEQLEYGDILRITEMTNGRHYVVNYIRGDNESITVTRDPYDEHCEMTYKRGDVEISVISRIDDIDRIVI
ncbi:MAG TPA: hypothetical protein VJH04_00275 [archaeon]|nr:hypothetical protein [archaeon]